MRWDLNADLPGYLLQSPPAVLLHTQLEGARPGAMGQSLDAALIEGPGNVNWMRRQAIDRWIVAKDTSDKGLLTSKYKKI
ncbi:hypothetical protein AAY473_001283 [Plecturocebus cupreus]